MKKKLKQILSALLVAVMLVGIAPIGGIDLSVKSSAMDLSSYKVGDIIEFGSYPQSRITGLKLSLELEKESSKYQWIDYNYYAGTGEWADGNTRPVENMMLYKDFSYGGSKYRAVKINQYRPVSTDDPSSRDYSQQDNNGYHEGEYYFKYEPLTWRVLNPSEGYVMCNSVIDSQAYQNFMYCKGEEYYNSKDCTNYASDWATSSIRQWLNEEFYRTAFTDAEKSQIGISHLENKNYSDNTYDGVDTYDKIFLLSYRDATNSTYGFNPLKDAGDTARWLKGTDYAKCQGLLVFDNDDNNINNDYYACVWFLRTPVDSHARLEVHTYGSIYLLMPSNRTFTGVVPAFKFNPKPLCTHVLDHITVPSTCKVAGMEYDICSECGETFNEKTLPLAAHTWSEWTVVKEATTTAEGQEKRTCSVCDKVETRAIEKLKVIKDDKTGIEINYNDEYDSDTEIKVEEQFSGKSFQLINTEFGKVNSKIYDIATYKDGVKVQPNGEITVKVPLPDGFTTNKVFVCYVDSVSGKVTKIPCEVKDGYVIFKTNHFSEYAIVEQSANVKSVSVSDITLNYKKSATIKPTIKADEGAKYTVKYSSSNTKVATVDENGKVYAAKKGSATITCTVTDSNGNTVQDTCKVTVKYSFGQWLIKILLFGWIWY